MRSSNDRLKEMADTVEVRQDPGFAAILAFEFYDGPERGLAIFPEGESIRFASLGDSPSRMRRAFELAAIDGDWWPQFNEIQSVETRIASPKFLLPSHPSKRLSRLEKDVFDATPTGIYVAIGSSYLESLRVAAVTNEELEKLRQQNFNAVNRIFP
jgi:hypothetical protein